MDFIKNKKFLFLGLGLVILSPILISLFITKILPGLKSALPQKEVKIIPPTPPAVSEEVQKGPYNCPSIEDFCKNGKDLEQNGAYVGFSGSLLKLSPVIAVFDGTIITTTSTLSDDFKNEKIVTVNLVNKERGLEAVYYFVGQVQSGDTVTQGQKIGSISEDMNYYQTSLLLQLYKGNSVTGEKVKLISSDFTF